MRAGQERPGSPEHSPRLDANTLAMGQIAAHTKKKPTAGRRWQWARFEMRRGRRCTAFSAGIASGRSRWPTTGSYRSPQILQCTNFISHVRNRYLRSVQRSQHGPPRRHISGLPVGSLRRNIPLDEAKVDAGRTPCTAFDLGRRKKQGGGALPTLCRHDIGSVDHCHLSRPNQ
jgi:hypothetical protein